MKLRDSLKSKSYFESYISYEDERISKFSQMLGGLDNKEAINRCKKYIASSYKNKLSAMYSVGYDKKSIEETFNKYISYIKGCGVESYADMVDVLSLIILFDSKSVITETKAYDDSLVSLLKGYIENKSLQQKKSDLLFPDIYKPFYDYLTDDLYGADKLFRFISENWYSANSAMWWYESHKSNNNTYNGYWCWLGAAVLKINPSDKEKTITCKYLPSDLIV